MTTRIVLSHRGDTFATPVVAVKSNATVGDRGLTVTANRNGG